MRNISSRNRQYQKGGNISVQLNDNTTIESQEKEKQEDIQEGQVPLNFNQYKKSQDKHLFLKKVFLCGVRHAQFDGEVHEINLKVLYEILHIMGFETNEFQLQEGYKFACFSNQYGNEIEKFTKLGTIIRKSSRERVEFKIGDKFNLDEYIIWLEKNLHNLKYDTSLQFYFMRNIRKGIYQIEKEDIKLPAYHLTEQEQNNLLQNYKTPNYKIAREDSPSKYEEEQERALKSFSSRNKKQIKNLESKRLDYNERQREYLQRQKILAKEFYRYHSNKFTPKKQPQANVRISTQGDFSQDTKEESSIIQTKTRCKTQLNETYTNHSNKQELNISPQSQQLPPFQRKILFSPETKRNEQKLESLKTQKIQQNAQLNKNQNKVETQNNKNNSSQKTEEIHKSILKNTPSSLNISPAFSPTRAQSTNGRYFKSTRNDEKKHQLIVPKENQKLKFSINPDQTNNQILDNYCDIKINQNLVGHRVQTTPSSPTNVQQMKEKEKYNKRFVQAKKDSDRRVNLILKNLKEMTELRRQHSIIPHDNRSQSDISEIEDEKELSKINVIPCNPEFYDLNKELTQLKNQTSVDIGTLINRIKQNNTIRDDILHNIQEIQLKRMKNNEILGKQGAIKAKRRLSECYYRQKKQEIKDLKYQALHDKDQMRSFRIEHLLSCTNKPKSKSPSHLQSLQNSPHITPKFKKKIGNLLSQNQF